MPKFRAGDLLINPQFATYYQVTGVFAQKYTMKVLKYEGSLSTVRTVSTPIDLADFVLELVKRTPFYYNQIWEEINA